MEESTASDISPQMTTSNFCEPCKQLENDRQATNYCKECDEYLCESCTANHQVAKATRTHKIITIETKEKQNSANMSCDYDCETCKQLQKTVSAIMYCDECEEFLCKACYDTHLVQKATKMHKPIDIATYVSRNVHNCDFCLNKVAAMYCKDCMEYYCNDCAAKHKAQKATKLHTLIEASAATATQTPPCIPCRYASIERPAMKYCDECEEYLCESCTTSHSSRKSTRLHTLSDAKTHAAASDAQDLCDICRLDGKNEIAKFICNVCNEKLCQLCSEKHSKQKATKSHKLNSLKEIKVHDDIFCEPCLQETAAVKASMYCKDCRENLCSKCANLHRRMKGSSSHEMTSPQKTISREVYCDLCLELSINKTAEKYCSVCDDNLCTECSLAHNKQKMSRNHKLQNMATEKMLSEIYCDACSIIDEQKHAIKMCIDCDENLCDGCVASHRIHKLSTGHKLSDRLKQPEVSQTSDQCKRHDESNVASVFCKECDELLCINCERQHLGEKSTSGHILVPASNVKRSKAKETRVCELCAYHGKQTTATSYCRSCAEPQLFCDDCSSRHTKMKPNRDHITTTDIEQFENSSNAGSSSVMTGISRNIGETMIDVQQRQSSTASSDSWQNKMRPGRPRATNIKADSLDLYWDKPEAFQPDDTYQLRYKDLDSETRWKFLQTTYTTSNIKLTDLKADTKFIFQVRMIHGDEEGPYSEESEEILTLNSPAGRIKGFSTLVSSGCPSKYALPITEIRTARFEKAKSKKFEVGSPHQNSQKERTIMLVGATGTGKSTLVDGLVNYVLGVNWDDPYRFTVIDLEHEEKDRSSNQALSQTEWITCYTIHPEKGSRLNYKLNIIDTPGFGDTRGLDRDNEIVSQIRELFSATDDKGVVYIDAVCFLIKAPDARLTATQKYIFNAIMSLFGQDIEKNICSLITFADGQEPPVLASLTAANLPFGKYFTFNNSGLFSSNDQASTMSLSPMFWDMGIKSYRAFFDNLDIMETKSLSLTKEVLYERQKLELTVASLQPQVDAGLSKVSALKQEMRIIKQLKTEINDNANFEYEVEEVHQIKKELPKGQHVTNCLHCHLTCHENCRFADDDDKARCSAMDSGGNCTVCSSKCHWTQHKNAGYVLQFETIKVKKTNQEKMQKYQDASGKLLKTEQVLYKMFDELKDLQEIIKDLMDEVNYSNNRLKEIALRPNPLSMVEHIDLMIQSEKLEQKSGWQGRIAALQEHRKTAEIGKRVAHMSEAAKGTQRAKKTPDKNSNRSSFMRYLQKLNPFS